MRKLIVGAAFLLGLALATAVLRSEAQQVGSQPSNWPYCNQTSIYNSTTNGSTILVTAIANMHVYVCGTHFWLGSTTTSTPTSVELRQGTGSGTGNVSCSITPVTIYPAFVLSPQSGWVEGPQAWSGLKTTILSQSVCVTTTATVNVQGIIHWMQF